MTTDARHSKATITNIGIHSIVAYEYADETARLAATGFTAFDLYKVAIQLDTSNLYILADISPITWVDFGNAGLQGQLNRVHIACRKSTAGTLPVGTVVYGVSYDTTNDWVTAEPARSDSASTLPAMGIIDQEATDSSSGFVMVAGIIEGLNTNGQSAQSPIYVSASTAGQYTTTAPSGPNTVQQLGVVLKEDLSDGAIGVNVQGYREIEYSATPQALGTAAAGTANKASAHDHVHANPIPDEDTILYVGKHGSDSNDGFSITKAFLTFGAAVSYANSQTPSPSNPFVVVCLDSGAYTEDITCVSYVTLYAPNAFLFGEITLVDFSGITFFRVTVGAGETAISKTAGTETSSLRVVGIDCSGSGNGILNDGTDSVIIADVDYINVDDGDAVEDNSSGSGHIHIRCGDIYIDGNGRGLVTAGGAGKIYADVDEVDDIGSGTTTGVAVLTGTVRANIRALECDTAYSVAGGATLEAFVAHLTGSTVETGTVKVTLAGVATGETNTASNVGTAGIGVFKQKTGVDLEFKKINAGSNKVTVTDDTGNDEVDIDVAEANLDHDNIGNVTSDQHHARQHGLGASADHTGALLSELNALVTDATLDDSSASRPPSGAASGDLGGTYPSPTVNDGADSTAIHDNISGEIALIAEKLSPVAADLVVLEDSAATNAKRRAQVGNLPPIDGADHGNLVGLSDDDHTLYHNDTRGDVRYYQKTEWTNKAQLDLVTDGDHDVRTDNPHSVTAVQAGAAPTVHTHVEADITDLDHTDADAIHDNVAGEIAAISPKIAPTTADFLVIEDAASANAKARITIGDLPVQVAQEMYELHPDMLVLPSGTDWSVNATASVTEDPSNGAIRIARYDDTTEEALGVLLTVPVGVTQILLRMKSRAVTAPGSVETVALTLHYREIPDNGAVGSWSQYDLTDIDVPTNANFQYDEQTVLLTTLSITAGRLYQLQLSRNAADAGDTLSGDWGLAQWDVGFDVDRLDRFLFYGDQLDYPTSSDWDINDPASGTPDSNDEALTVRRFDDTTQEAVGWALSIPPAATSLILSEKSRAETAPGGAQTVARTLHYREIPDNGAVGSWSTLDLTDINIPTSELWQYDSQTITLATLGVTAGRLYQWELSRDTADAGDTLVGDWTLAELTVEFV